MISILGQVFGFENLRVKNSYTSPFLKLLTHVSSGDLANVHHHLQDLALLPMSCHCAYRIVPGPSESLFPQPLTPSLNAEFILDQKLTHLGVHQSLQEGKKEIKSQTWRCFSRWLVFRVLSTQVRKRSHGFYMWRFSCTNLQSSVSELPVTIY